MVPFSLKRSIARNKAFTQNGSRSQNAKFGSWARKVPCFRSCRLQMAQNRRPTAFALMFQGGGEGGIRTHETVARLHAFQACAFDHSATSPQQSHARSFRVDRRQAHAFFSWHMANAICGAPSTTRPPLLNSLTPVRSVRIEDKRTLSFLGIWLTPYAGRLRPLGHLSEDLRRGGTADLIEKALKHAPHPRKHLITTPRKHPITTFARITFEQATVSTYLSGGAGVRARRDPAG